MPEMHASKEDLSSSEGKGQFGDYTVEFGSLEAGGPPAEVFRDLPNGACQCPHWGYLFKGKFKIPYTDGHEEIVKAGEAYYLPPGHRLECLEDIEYVEFSPTREYEEMLRIVSKTIEEMES